MADDEAHVLPEGYYLGNFFYLIESADKRYADILSDVETTFIADFKKLPLPAQRLYVRLVSRKGPYFRADTLRYDEIPDINAVVKNLAETGFALLGGDYELLNALHLLKVGELRSSFPELPKGGRKAEVVEWIVETCEHADTRQRIDQKLTVIEPMYAEIVATLMLLFFGNSRQNLSEFVIADLGVVSYEKYPLDPETRPFENRKAVDAMLSYYDASERLFELTEQHDVQGIVDLGEIFGSIEFPERLRHRKDRVMNGIARQLEREGERETAHLFYGETMYPPSRERRARILAAQGEHHVTAQLLREILADPLSEEELEFAQGFSLRQYRKFGSPFEEVNTQKFSYAEERVSLNRIPDQSVEEITLSHFTELGFEGAWCENALMNGLFGLVFWDIIFLPQPGVFYNQFQRGPADLMLPDFRHRREREFDERLSDITRDETWRERTDDLYIEKNGIGNAFINWRRFPHSLVQMALQRIPSAHLYGIFDRMSRDVRANTSGFPDLVVFPPEGGMGDYTLIEVKGPGDQVQKNQLRWMRRFEEFHVPYRVLWVDYL